MHRIKTIDPSGREAFTDVQPDKYVLPQLMKAKVLMPRSCMGGTCGECVAKLVSGSVDMYDQAFLTPEEVEEGFILTCVAYALEDCVVKTHQQDAAIDFSSKISGLPAPPPLLPAIASLNPGYGFLHDKMRLAVLSMFDQAAEILVVEIDDVEAKVILKNNRILSPGPESPDYKKITVVSCPSTYGKEEVGMRKRVIMGLHGYAIVFKTWAYKPEDYL